MVICIMLCYRVIYILKWLKTCLILFFWILRYFLFNSMSLDTENLIYACNNVLSKMERFHQSSGGVSLVIFRSTSVIVVA